MVVCNEYINACSAYLVDADTVEVVPFLAAVAPNHVILIRGLAQTIETHRFARD